MDDGLTTWVEENATQFLRGCSVLDYGKSRIASRAVVIVHRNLEVSTLKVWIRGSDTEDLAIPPRNLQDVHKGHDKVTLAEHSPKNHPEA